MLYGVAVVMVITLVGLIPGGEAQGDELTYRVKEEQARGTVIGNIQRDSNVSAAVADLTSISYRILRQTSAPGSYFNIGNTSGVLTTAFVLDRENITICEFKRTCKFSIYIAMQSGQFFRTILVNVYLDDINDEKPRFPHPRITLNIPESVSVGYSRPIDSAEDLDGGENNSIQSYEMIPANVTFVLIVTKSLTGGDNLRIEVISPLDRETKDSYQRIIRAKDGGANPNVGEMIVNISITDVNDHSPVFFQTEYVVNISEALQSGVEIITVHATDLDSGKNGHIYYRLSAQQTVSNRHFFKIDETSGEITPRTELASLQGRTVKLYVEAYDGGSEPRVSSTVVTITVLDTVNDPPHIELSVVSGDTTANVLERAPIGFPVAHLIVSDEDAGSNGQVNCSVLSDMFQLQSLKVNEYKVVVAGTLDRERAPHYNVSVACQDMGRPRLRSTTSFSVTLLDVNDNPPVFRQSHYVVNISENNQIGQELAQPHASDRDVGENGRITYKITSHYSRFSYYINIDPDSGIISTVGKLDREMFDVLNITIFAFDHGTPPLQANASLIINIIDENDNEPKFKETVYLFRVLENQAIDTHVGTVKASDPDLNGGGFVTYTIMDVGMYVPFILTSTGILLSNDVFDREKEPEYTFDVEARDHGYPPLFNRVRVIVEVEDVNDHQPVVTYPNNVNMTAKTSYQSPPGTQVDVAKGKDNDTGLNAQLVFSMRAESSEKPFLFSMDGSSGIIFVNKHLREDDIGTYVVYVSASDKGSPPLTSQERVLEITVFVGNSTSYLSGITAGQNALIVITLLCLTVITAAIVLMVLLRIRRRDRQKKSEGDVTLDELPRGSPLSEYPGETDGGFSSYKPVQCDDEVGGKDNSLHVIRKEKKHELLLFKMQLAEQYKQRDQENSQKTDQSSKMQQESGLKLPPEMEKYDVTDQQMTRLAALKYQQALIRGSKKGPPQQTIRYGPGGETITDDILSNSSGETTATDSGRGYSEEDCHSQGRSSLPSETDDSGFPVVRFDCVRDPKNTWSNSPSKNVLRNSIPLFRQCDGNNVQPSLNGDCSPRSSDSVQLRHTGPRRKPYSVHFDKLLHDKDFQSRVPQNLDPLSNSCHHHSISRLCDPNMTFHKGTAAGFSLDNLNDSVDDDNTTTTSGSYTIDHDDFQDDGITFSQYGLKDVYV